MIMMMNMSLQNNFYDANAMMLLMTMMITMTVMTLMTMTIVMMMT